MSIYAQRASFHLFQCQAWLAKIRDEDEVFNERTEFPWGREWYFGEAIFRVLSEAVIGTINVQWGVLPSAHIAALGVECVLCFPYAVKRGYGITAVPAGSIGIATGRSSAEGDQETSKETTEAEADSAALRNLHFQSYKSQGNEWVVVLQENIHINHHWAVLRVKM